MRKFFKNLMIKFYMFMVSEHIVKYVVSALLCFGILFLVGVLNSTVMSDIFSILIGFLFGQIFIGILNVVMGNLEDATKVTEDTEKLLSIYTGKDNRKDFIYNGSNCLVAYKHLIVNKGYKFIVEDHPDSEFVLDEFIMNNYTELFLAHSQSSKSNSATIRMDGFEKRGDEYVIHLGRSDYYKHLVTNRSIDFRIADDLTLRDVFEYGPEISSPEESKMSNHVGINALVYLSDGEMLLPKRKKDSTISKNKVTSAIAMKLDFPEDGNIDEIYLFDKCIKTGLIKRTKFNKEWLETKDIKIDFLGLGLNLYEGGKPQFYYRVVISDLTRLEYLTYLKDHMNDNFGKLDSDKCIYVLEKDSLKFVGDDDLTFKHYTLSDVEKGRSASGKKKLSYEKSFAANIWHDIQ